MSITSTIVLQTPSHGNEFEPDPGFHMLQRSEGETIDLFLYDYIESDQKNPHTGAIRKSETSAEEFKKILDKHAKAKRINLYVNCRGGSMTEALGIRAHLLRHQAADKRAYIDGWSASPASIVVTAFDEVCMLSGAMQHISPMWLVCAGNADQLRKVADEVDTMTESIQKMFLEKSDGKLTLRTLQALMKEESWLTTEECVKYGLADRVLTTKEYRDHLQQKLPAGGFQQKGGGDPRVRDRLMAMMLATEFAMTKIRSMDHKKEGR